MEIERLVVGDLEENCYLIIDNNNCLIVDPGEEFKKIDKYIVDNKLQVVGVLITHYHFDHIGALDEVLDKYDVKVYDYNTIGEFSVNNFFFEVISNPGHSKDSVSFNFKDSNVMFCGDFIFKGNIGRMDFPGGSVDDMKVSISNVKNLNHDIVLYPGHGDKINLGFEVKFNMYFQDGIL